jgi:spermidine/putrescine transport system substrate-binding protein
MKRLILFTVILLAACSPAAPADSPLTPVATTPPTADAASSPLKAALEQEIGWVCPPEFAGQTLNVANWDLYVTDTTIPNFQTLCDVTVNYTTYASNEDLIAQLQSGDANYDVVFPSDYATAIMIQDEMLRPLTYANIPNFANISEDLRNPPYDPGSQYAVPYQWGTIGLLYNITRTGEQITSWQQMFDYTRGSVNWLEDTRGMMSMALNQLDYNPNTQNQAEINAARDYLVEHSGNVAAIAEYGTYDLLINGEADIAIEYSGAVNLIAGQCECDDFRFAIPAEGTVLWVDKIAIPVGAPNPRLAEAFIDYILQPRVGADISNYTGYASPNQVAINLGMIDDAFLSNVNIYPTDEIRSHLYFTDTNTTTQELQVTAWESVKAAIAQP